MRHRFVAAHAERIDKLIAEQTPLSRKRARALLSQGGVRVDGARVTHPAHAVPVGAVIEVRTVADTRKAPTLVERYRDEQVLVIDKPSGLPTQGTQKGGRQHVFGLLSATERYVGLHHRLDAPASGLVLFTLDRAANSAIAAAFKGGEISRRYLAVLVGDPGEEGRWTESIQGRYAETTWRRVSQAEGMSVIEASLVTGRTHQVRIHAANAGFPIVGDRRHGGAAGRAWPRLALHAWRLSFTHPTTGEQIQVEAPPPEDLAPLLKRAGFTG